MLISVSVFHALQQLNIDQQFCPKRSCLGRGRCSLDLGITTNKCAWGLTSSKGSLSTISEGPYKLESIFKSCLFQLQLLPGSTVLEMIHPCCERALVLVAKTKTSVLSSGSEALSQVSTQLYPGFCLIFSASCNIIVGKNKTDGELLCLVLAKTNKKFHTFILYMLCSLLWM